MTHARRRAALAAAILSIAVVVLWTRGVPAGQDLPDRAPGGDEPEVRPPMRRSPVDPSDASPSAPSSELEAMVALHPSIAEATGAEVVRCALPDDAGIRHGSVLGIRTFEIAGSMLVALHDFGVVQSGAVQTVAFAGRDVLLGDNDGSWVVAAVAPDGSCEVVDAGASAAISGRVAALPEGATEVAVVGCGGQSALDADGGFALEGFNWEGCGLALRWRDGSGYRSGPTVPLESLRTGGVLPSTPSSPWDPNTENARTHPFIEAMVQTLAPP